MNQLCQLLSYKKKFRIICYNFWCVVAVCYSSIAPQVEKECGAEGEEKIGDSQEQLRIILIIPTEKNLCTNSFHLPQSWKLHYCNHVDIRYSESSAIGNTSHLL